METENMTGAIDQFGYRNLHRHDNWKILQTHYERKVSRTENFGNSQNTSIGNQGNMWIRTDNFGDRYTDGNYYNRNEHDNTMNTMPTTNSVEMVKFSGNIRRITTE